MVPLAIAPAYRKLAAQQGGLPATVYLTFTATGHPTLHERVAVTFVITGRGARRRHVGAATARRPGVRR
jgi:superfamily II DNA helicase RecQ